MRLICLNKPYGTICQFSGESGHTTLAAYITQPGVYAAGRLDADSEGLLLLTDDGPLQARIAHPRHKLVKRYLAQVEGIASDAALDRLSRGVDLGDYVTRPAHVRIVPEPPGLWPRDPPIRVRRAIPTSWLELAIAEGKNRQVRRMTAAVGLPTLRLIRASMGAIDLFALGLAPGQSRELAPDAPWHAHADHTLSAR
ncbi:MAG: pseudouridine synthase [Janthinobacterium lividum]